jgi:N-acetylmuramoyl-L-alanine amidase
MRLFRPILCLVFLFFIIGLSLVEAHAATISDVSMASDMATGGVRFEVSADQHVPYRVFTLDNPKRVVIDLPAMRWTAPLNKGDRTGIIRAYRYGLFQGDTLRIVLDVSRPVSILKTETVANASGQYRYIVYLQPTNRGDFTQSLNKVIQPTAPVATSQETLTQTTTVTQTITETPAAAPGKKLIVIDAGHGGVDPGAIATNGVYEKNITLGVARELKRRLEATGRYRVKMTRDSDVFIILQNRVKIARAAKGDLFVSLHADTISRPAVQGASVYTLSNQASDAEAARLAERENQVDALVGGVDLGTQDKDVADILLDLVVRDNMNQSKILADTVVTGLRRGGVQTLAGSHRFAGFAVLKAPDIPSILIEMGYLSNRQEAARLNTEAHRQRIAQAVMDSIDRYFGETSKKTEF